MPRPQFLPVPSTATPTTSGLQSFASLLYAEECSGLKFWADHHNPCDIKK